MSALVNLMLSPTGLGFDPEAGNTYTLNETGLVVLKAFQLGDSAEAVVERLVETYDVSRADAERDVTDFQIRLRSLGLM
jgi:hypothetical protein